MKQEYLIFEDRPAYPSKQKQVFGAYPTRGRKWEEVREWLSADVASYRRVMADSKADAVKQAEILWKKAEPILDLCKTCDRSGRCSFETNKLVCKRIADAHFQLKRGEKLLPWTDTNPSVQTDSGIAARMRGEVPPGFRSARDLVMKNKKLLHDHAADFQKFFKVPLAPYMNDYTGFDIVKFDELIKTPKGMSTHDFVKRKYGLQALNMIKDLIGMGEKPPKSEMTKGR